MIFTATGKILSHVFLARGRVRAPLLSAAAGVAVYAGLGEFTASRFGYPGLAVLQSAGMGLSLVFIVAALLRSLGRPRGEKVIPSLAGILLAGIAAALTLFFGSPLLPSPAEPILLRLLLLGVLSAIALSIYAGTLALLRNPHLAHLLRSLSSP